MSGGKRKTLMVDQELVDAIKSIASKYGMSIAAYMRALIRSVVDVEAKGFFAPSILNQSRLLLALIRLGVVPLPTDLLEQCRRSPDEARKRGYSLAKTMESLGYEPLEYLYMVAEGVKNILIENDKILVFRSGVEEQCLTEYIIGFIEGCGLEKSGAQGEIIIFKLRRRGS